ncbi:MAG TPA: adenylate/guanylate cyclase domain-containing protein [Fimbriimonadaceae bacterium]|nr:adenylate/guanylate cyclase domain-containing protein [Fimbriimonadaceae bacterium]
MTRRKLRRLGGLVAIWLSAMGAILRLLPNELEVRRGYVLGYGLACALAIAALSQVHRHLLPQIRRMPFYVIVGVTSLLYMGAIVISSAVGIGIMVGSATRSLGAVRQALVPFFARGWEVTLLAPFLVALAILFTVELARRIGPRRIVSLMLGRYRNPVEESRLFLLVDLRGSTTLAERLGTVEYSAFLREFFEDLTEPVLDTGGDVVEYVGDEAVVSWPFRNRPGLRARNAMAGLTCFLRFRARISGRTGQYIQRFGLVPEFKGALHAGPVVATEVGQLKTQLVFHGDALNTSARILAECNGYKADLLISETVLPYLGETPGVPIEDLGKVSLRGKVEPVGLGRIGALSGDDVREPGERQPILN